MVFFSETYIEERWYAIHTRHHHERQVSSRLKGKEIETFLPLRCLNRRWKDRKKLVDFPLFPGYVFVKIPLLNKKDVVQTPGVVRIVGSRGPEPLPESQIIAVKRFIETEIQFDPYPYLVSGMEIEVIRGPLKHVRGVLVNKKNKYRLIVNLDLINKSVSTEIDAEDVEAV